MIGGTGPGRLRLKGGVVAGNTGAGGRGVSRGDRGRRRQCPGYAAADTTTATVVPASTIRTPTGTVPPIPGSPPRPSDHRYRGPPFPDPYAYRYRPPNSCLRDACLLETGCCVAEALDDNCLLTALLLLPRFTATTVSAAVGRSRQRRGA